jgi:uncharacterized surface protein with fasciclin (FAS1) repeats
LSLAIHKKWDIYPRHVFRLTPPAWVRPRKGNPMPATPQPQSIAAALAQSGIGFDGNDADFDILNAALGAAGLTAALADPGATLTLFAPTARPS